MYWVLFLFSFKVKAGYRETGWHCSSPAGFLWPGFRESRASKLMLVSSLLEDVRTWTYYFPEASILSRYRAVEISPCPPLFQLTAPGTSHLNARKAPESPEDLGSPFTDEASHVQKEEIVSKGT